MTQVNITIEGPAGAGKTLVLRAIAPLLANLGHPVQAFEGDMEVGPVFRDPEPLPVRETVSVVITALPANG